MAFRFVRAIKDFKNWRYIRKIVRQAEKTPEWKIHNMTHDWFYRIASVVNMRKEDFGEQPEIHQVRYLDFARPTLEYVGEKLGLGEIVIPEHYRIGDDYAYLVVFHQRRTGLSIWYVFSRLVLIAGAIATWCYFH